MAWTDSLVSLEELQQAKAEATGSSLPETSVLGYTDVGDVSVPIDLPEDLLEEVAKSQQLVVEPMFDYLPAFTPMTLAEDVTTLTGTLSQSDNDIIAQVAAALGATIAWVTANWGWIAPLATIILGGIGIASVDDLFDYVGGDGASSPGGTTEMSNGLMVIPGTDIVLQGPGEPEPYPKMIVKEWAGIGGSRFYLLINGRVAVRRKNHTWHLIRRPRMLHMKVSNPRMGDVVKADRIVQRTAKILRRRLKK